LKINSGPRGGVAA